MICSWIPVWQIETVDQNSHQTATCSGKEREKGGHFGLLDMIFRGILVISGKEGISTDSRHFRWGFWNNIYCFIFCLHCCLCLLAVSSISVCVLSTVCTVSGCWLFSDGKLPCFFCKSTALVVICGYYKVLPSITFFLIVSKPHSVSVLVWNLCMVQVYLNREAEMIMPRKIHNVQAALPNWSLPKVCLHAFCERKYLKTHEESSSHISTPIAKIPGLFLSHKSTSQSRRRDTRPLVWKHHLICNVTLREIDTR